MLIVVIRAMINNLFKVSFYKKKKKIINILTILSIFYKRSVNNFLKWIIN